MTGLSDFLAVFAERGPRWLDQMAQAFGVTLEITVLAFLPALAIGLVAAIGRLSRDRTARALAIDYVEVMHGVPALVILFLLCFGITPPGIVLDAVPAAVIGPA